MSTPTKALRKYLEFHGQDPRKIGQFHRDLVIPERAVCVGVATQVLYRSDKLNPTTLEDEGWIDYFHDHDDGVQLYRTDRKVSEGVERAVPKWLRDVSSLTWLGYCLGFSYSDHAGAECSADASKPLPELFCVPSGRALLVIQNKRSVLAMMWGGRLGVENRGIVH
jgi:hypothetical protein